MEKKERLRRSLRNTGVSYKCGCPCIISRIFRKLKDRLTRFGFDYLQRYFSSHGVKIEVVEETEKNYFEELIEEFCLNNHQFCGKNI